jgi:hypothetical protein
MFNNGGSFFIRYRLGHTITPNKHNTPLDYKKLNRYSASADVEPLFDMPGSLRFLTAIQIPPFPCHHITEQGGACQYIR